MKNNTNKLISILVLVAFIASACSSVATSVQTTEKPATQETTVVLLTQAPTEQSQPTENALPDSVSSLIPVAGSYQFAEGAANDLIRPNGIVGAPDGKTLYIADHGAGQTFAYTIQFELIGCDAYNTDFALEFSLFGRNIAIYLVTRMRIAVLMRK